MKKNEILGHHNIGHNGYGALKGDTVLFGGSYQRLKGMTTPLGGSENSSVNGWKHLQKAANSIFRVTHS